MMHRHSMRLEMIGFVLHCLTCQARPRTNTETMWDGIVHRNQKCIPVAVRLSKKEKP